MMTKGQTNEILNLSILIVGITIIFILYYFIATSSHRIVGQSITNYHNYNRILNIVNNFYYSKISGTETTLAQFLADRILYNENPIYYGDGYTYIDVDSMITKFFDLYFDDRWKLEIPNQSQILELGHEKPISNFQTFEILLPIPSNNYKIVKGYLYVWAE